MNIYDSKTKNSSRNLIFGIFLKIYQLLVPFIIRTIIIKVLGMEYAGLNSLFTSILQVLNIAELGVGSALVYSMYKPIAENDSKRICALMQLYKIYYRIIGFVILVIGLSITPILPHLIKGNIPSEINLYILYYLNLSATVISYWLFAYKNSLFQAHQRNDIVSKITIITNTIQYILQISLLFIFKNYYYYVMILLFTQILNNIFISFRADKTFPTYKACGSLQKQEIKKINNSIKDLFYGQLGLIITTSVDSIVISSFLGLLSLAIYQNYYYILNAIIGFFLIFYQSCRASIGTNIISKSMEKNFEDYKFITFIVMWALSFCISCLLCMYQPFIELWVGKENMLDQLCVVLFGIYLLVYELSLMIGTYKDASGKWHKDRFRHLLTALFNLITNIILVNVIGIYGILISTILSYTFINIPWLYHRVFIDIFDKKYKKQYLFYLIKKISLLIFIVLINYLLCGFNKIHNLIFVLIINFIICTINSILIYYFFNKDDISLIRMIYILKKIIKTCFER